MPPQSLEIRSAHDVPVTVHRWIPPGPPRGIVQLTHGMGEHLLRYEPLAGELTAAGFVVVGQDHRGHGATAASGQWGVLGPGGWDELVRDIGRSASWRGPSTPACRWCCSATAGARSWRRSA